MALDNDNISTIFSHILKLIIGKTDRNCRIDWICYSKEIISAQDALKFYGEIWIFNGAIDKCKYHNGIVGKGMRT